MLAAHAWAAEWRDADAPPQLGPRGVAGYRDYLAGGNHRAFAIAPGGAWAWRADLPSADSAEQAALADCQEQTRQTCVPYAVDETVVFDAKRWPGLWGPYARAEAARRAPEGIQRGERFPDLRLFDPGGKPRKLSDYRGQVVVLHFWGSWCGPCRRELPDLQALAQKLAGQRDILFIWAPMRESVDAARAWAGQQGLTLPLSELDGALPPGRPLARMFPTTYVLDKHGLVIFSHAGDASRWGEYLPFLKDAARHSGK